MNLISELKIAISYALVGNIDNPQAKILNVRYDWETTDLRLPDVNLLFTRDLLIRTRVTFLDFSLNPEYTQSILKRSNLVLPTDFFKPFSSNSSY